MAKRFASSGAALIVFGLYLSWPFAFSWEAVVANVASLVRAGIGWRLLLFILATGGVAVLLRPRYPATAEWVGSLAVLALLYPLFGLSAGLPKLGGWPGMFVSVGAICLAAGGSAWLVAAACQLGARRASWPGAFGPRAEGSAAGEPASRLVRNAARR